MLTTSHLHRLFQSTPPVKAATSFVSLADAPPDISIHAAREGGDGEGYEINYRTLISIHAAREGGDSRCDIATQAHLNFNPRRP